MCRVHKENSLPVSSTRGEPENFFVKSTKCQHMSFFVHLKVEQYWHEDCLKCGCCNCRLGEVSANRRLFAFQVFLLELIGHL